MIRTLTSTSSPIAHCQKSHLISHTLRFLATTAPSRATQRDHQTPFPFRTSPIPASPRGRPNRRSTETDPCLTERDASSRKQQFEDIEMRGLMPELLDAILRHPRVEATMVTRDEKIPRELEMVGQKTQHASGFIPPTPGMSRQPEKEV